MTRRQRRARLAVLAALALVLVTSSAHGHALLEGADPAPGTVLPEDRGARRLSLTFTEPVTIGQNAVVILDGNRRRVGPLTARVTSPGRVEVDAPSLAPGAYAVRWLVTSADTHVVRGTYWFAVGFASAPPPAVSLLGTAAAAFPALEVIARWLALIAVLGLTGIVFFEAIAVRPSHVSGMVMSDRRRATTALIAVLVSAELLRAMAQAVATAELPLPQALDVATLREVLFGSRFALLWWARVLLGIVLGALFAGAGRGTGARRRASIAVSALLLASTAAAGHAASRTPLGITYVADVLHLGAATLWLGGLVYVGWCLARRTGDDQPRAVALAALVPRLSAIALTSVLVLFATGAVNAYAQVPSVGSLLRSAYGQSLLIKLALLVPWLAIAATNRLALRPRVAAGDPNVSAHFTGLVRAEALFGVAVLLVVGLLGSLPPPGPKALPEPAEVSRQAGDLRIALSADPNWVGVSRFRVTLADAHGQPPPGVRRVVLTFTMDGMNIGRTHVTLAPRGDGVWDTSGFYVGMPGLSQVGVALTRDGVPDTNAVFRIEVPDTNPAQLAGLREALGAGPLVLFGAGTGLCVMFGLLAASGARRRLLPAGVVAVALLGVGPIALDLTSGTHDGATGFPPSDAGNALRGRELYERQCAVCHGTTGTGNGPAAASLLPPPADLTVHARWHADEQLFWFISHGVPGTSMVGFADRLSPRDRWDTIRHLRALASAPTATTLRSPPLRPPASPSTQASPPTPASPSTSVSPSPPPSAVAAATPAEARAESSPASPAGRLVYGPDFDNNLWLMTLPDGKTSSLTRFGPLEFPSNPAWSPDGRRLAFSYYRLPGGDAIPVPDGTDLYVMSASGGDMRMLAGHDVRGAALQYPAWSADGRAVYAGFVGPGGAALGIDRIDVTSGARVRVVPNAQFPAPSRDGRRLAYVRVEMPPARGQSVWWSAPDGSHAQQIVPPSAFDKLFAPRFAPDGKRLLFAAVGQPSGSSSPGARRLDPLRWLGRAVGVTPASANGDLWDLWTVDLDGRSLRPLTSLSEDLPVAAWSPDGTHVAFLGGGSARTAEAGVTVLGPTGGVWRRLTSQPGHRGLDWTKR